MLTRSSIRNSSAPYLSGFGPAKVRACLVPLAASYPADAQPLLLASPNQSVWICHYHLRACRPHKSETFTALQLLDILLHLSLATHRQVDGWDRDVIAEDHHMFCKCYFASIWEQLEEMEADPQNMSVKAVKSSLQLKPVYLPAISFLVESDDGWLQSIYCRFQQARRHSQGLAELSYVYLQHFHVLKSEYASRLAWSTHARILAVGGKMASVHIIANIHSLAIMLATAVLVPGFIRWLLSTGLAEIFEALSTRGIEGLLSLPSVAGIDIKGILCAIFGPIPPMGFSMTAVTYLVVLDTVEGRLTKDVAQPPDPNEDATTLAAPDVQCCARGQNGIGMWERIKLFLMIQTDYFGGAFITLFCYGLWPASLAAFSLMKQNGMGFEYVVGVKPTTPCNGMQPEFRGFRRTD
eukprot:TRINITY_DN4715_c0_g1_i4.p1 TRINITY_DN4715_c0_g1~~TRINITY_DN4715_c0_g1_i4.p1  ORF type:complete len:409 (+),score=65.54 TRINITY_DN4715_c0_g1_i4:858-2084(+)